MYRIIPVTPVMPVIPDISRIENIAPTVLLTLLSAILFIGMALLVGWLLTLVLKKQNFKANLAVNLSLSGVAAVALFLRFGMSVTILQGLFVFFILLFASWSDLTDHEVTDWVWISLIPMALMSIPTVGLTSMIAGAFVVFVPQIAMALLPPHKTLGGADIKISTVLAFMLGFGRGIIAYLVALVVAVIFMNIYNKVRKRCPRMPFALVPFLAGVAFIAFLI